MKSLLVVALAAAVTLVGCSKPPKDSLVSPVNPTMRIQSLPPADPVKLGAVGNMKNWKNPYLIVRVDGVGLLDASNNEQKLLTPDQLVQALADLPNTAWPYGRAVAVAEGPTSGSDADKAQMRKNRALVAGTLESLKVMINWVPVS